MLRIGLDIRTRPFGIHPVPLAAFDEFFPVQNFDLSAFAWFLDHLRL